VVYLKYMLSELGRRRGRTFLTALGLAVGVGLVVTVSALSAGLDHAQQKVLQPLTGVGTDMSVTRPISLSSSGNGNPFSGLSAKEREQLRAENGPRRLDFRRLKAGSKFSRDDFVAAAQLSFPSSDVQTIAALAGVRAAAGGLTLNATHVTGTVPNQTQLQQGGPQQQGGGGAGGFFAGPRSIDFSSMSVSGVDQTHPELGAITSGQIAKGRYFHDDSAREAILNIAYAKRQNLGVGDTIKLGGKTFTVVGLAKTPLGGQSSDVYVKLTQLQKLSDRVGRVNTVYVRANNSDQVGALSRHIKATIPGASVTTAKDLADRVSGSLVDAKNLAGKLGLALELVALLGAFLIASLLTLSSVTKRIRELGTLKAIGWRQGLVVRQVTGESLLQGLLGGVLGIAVGLVGVLLIDAFAPTLQATVASAAQSALPGPFAFGQGAPTNTSASEAVSLTAQVSPGLIVLAVALAVAGGLVSGAIGGFRAARLRPADALRHID
jgi:ABC-type antimicrobial peptide transport system permease subunit